MVGPLSINIISSSALAGTIHLSTSEAWAGGVGFVKLTLASCQWNIQVIENECASTQHLAPVRNISLGGGAVNGIREANSR